MQKYIALKKFSLKAQIVILFEFYIVFNFSIKSKSH